MVEQEEAKLSLIEAIAIGVGGMVGGGIFSVLGLSASIAGHASFISFLFGGIIALLTGLSYAALGLKYHSEGGSFAYLQKAFTNRHVSAIGGWLLIVGYLGTLALYAYTFGAYGASMFMNAGASGFETWHKILSIGVLVIFLLINLLGAKTTGTTELVIVAIKVGILGFFAVVAMTSVQKDLVLPVFNTGMKELIIASSLIFVAYEGFELIPNAINELKDPDTNLRKAIMYSILITISIYVIVAFVAVGNLTPEQINQYKEYALAVAAQTRLHEMGFVLIGVAALFSTSSAINATLFGTARLMYDMASKEDLPKSFAIKDKRHGVPVISLLVISVFSALFVFFSDLSEIASFASITFLVIFSMINYSALKLRKTIQIRWIWPFTGLLLSFLSLGILVTYLGVTSARTIGFIIGVYIIIILVEIVFSKRGVVNRRD